MRYLQRNQRSPIRIPAIALVALVATNSELAYGYLDPGTGSLILQGLIAGLAATLFAIKTYWHKLMSLFGKAPPRSLLDDPALSEQPKDTQRATDDKPADE